MMGIEGVKTSAPKEPSEVPRWLLMKEKIPKPKTRWLVLKSPDRSTLPSTTPPLYSLRP